MRIVKRIISAVLAAAMLLPGLTVDILGTETASGTVSLQSGMSISNDYMEFSINKDTGFFAITTLEGHPQKKGDNNIALLYDGDSIETSFTTVRIDGTDYIFGQEYGIFGIDTKMEEPKVDVVNNIISRTWTIHSISITEKAQLSRTDNTSTTGSVRLSYEVVNNAGKAHTVGIRVMLDNALGTIDAPITMTQNELAPISKEAEFFVKNADGTVRDPGMYIRYIDSYENPTKEAYITFSGLETPDVSRMVVGHWYHLASSKWQCTPDTDLAFDNGFNTYGTADTATALYWNETTLNPEGKLIRSLTYGVGEFTADAASAEFNISLSLNGELEFNEAGEYKNDIYDATLQVYNNVDGSVDIQNATLNLAVDSGLKILLPADDETFVYLDEYTSQLGFMAAGTVETYTFQIQVEEQIELTPLEVRATVRGNSDTDSVRASQYILAPGRKATEYSVSVETITDKTYHCEGQRVMMAFGSFPSALMEDRTLWAAAFVNTQDKSIRYEIDTDSIVVDDKRMTIQYTGDMVIGQYALELAFYGALEELVGNVYTSSATFSIVNNPSLMTNQYAYVVAYRTGAGTASQYYIQSLSSDAALEAFKQSLEAKNDANNDNVAEAILVLKGSFEAIRNDDEQIVGYSALQDFTVNDVITGKKGSTLTYGDFTESSKNPGTFYWNYVILNGVGEVRTATSPIMDSDWHIILTNNVFYSISSKNVKLEATGLPGYMMDIAGGLINLKYGVFGKDAELGNYISFGGSFTLTGYGVANGDYMTTDAPPVNDLGFNAAKYQTPEKLKVNKKTIYAGAAIDDVIFNKDGFCGINTTIEIGVGASNILRTSNKEMFSLMLYINTFDNMTVGGEITFSVKSYTVVLGIEFRMATTKLGESQLLINSIKASVAIPPTAPLDLIPPYVGLTSAGFALNGLVDAIELTGMEAQEAVAAVSSLTSNITVSIGAIIVRVLSATGILELSPNHFTLTVVLGSPYLPGLTGTVSAGMKWRVAVRDKDGNVLSPLKISAFLFLGANIFDIALVNGTLSISAAGETGNPEEAFANESVHGGLQIYGVVKVPAVVPVFGGMELFDGTGIINDIGFSLAFHVCGVEFIVSQGWDDEDVAFTYAVGEGEDEKISFGNMQMLLVEEVPEEPASVFALRRTMAELPTMTSYITTVDSSDAVIAVRYTGEHPSADGLALTIDGEEYPLTEATADDYYGNGNCAIVPDADGEGGRIIIGVKNPGAGKKTYTITSASELIFTGMEALALQGSASIESVAVNADESITVTADRSLKGSTVNLYYTDSPDLYENIRTDTYEEDGETKLRVYSVDADGHEIDLDMNGMSKISEHCVYTETVTADSDTITIPKSALDVDENMKSGEYYVLAAVISTNRRVTRASDKTSRMIHENANEPEQVASASLVDIGDETLELVITDGESADYDGYYISVYDSEGEYLIEDTYYSTDEVITFDGEAGKTYQAEIYTVKTVSDGDTSDVAVSGSAYTTEPVTLHKPTTVEITSFVMNNDTVSGSFTRMDETGENVTDMVDYISGRTASFTVTTAEDVQGYFIIDGMEAIMNAPDKLTNQFFYYGEFDEGVHTVAFRAVNSQGDSTVTEGITFGVNVSEASILVESAIIPVAEDGTITIRGLAHNTETIAFQGKTYTPAADGTFEITEAVSLDRFAQRYMLTATGPSDLTAVSSILVVDTSYEPISSVDILVDGVSEDQITAEPGDTLTLSAVGYAGSEIRDVSDGAELSVVKGSNVAVLDGNSLKLTASGTAFVKLTYNMGSYILDSRTDDYRFEDIIEITVSERSSGVTASIPNGATVEKGTLLTLEGDGTIYYTTDGSEPTTDSLRYTGPIEITESVIIKARAYADGELASEITTITVNVSDNSDGGGIFIPILKPNEPVIGSSVTDTSVDEGYPVELTTDADGVICYTTDGTTPDRNSAKYEAPIILTEDTVIKAVVWYGGDRYSEVQTFTYTINTYWIRLNGEIQKTQLMNGYPDGTFRPDDKLTRAEAATILRRATIMTGYHISDGVFSDTEMWAEQYINELAAAGIVNGYPDGTFRPDNTVTRAEFVTMLMRIIGQEGGRNGFADVQGHWAEKYVAKAAEYGYVGGYPDGTFRPDASITRAEAFKIMSTVFGWEADGTESRFTDVTEAHWAFGYIAD